MSAFEGITTVTSQEEFDALAAAHTHVLAFFWADWHDPSKPGGQMDSVFTALSGRYPTVAFAKIEAENVETASVAEALGVSVVPTFVGVLAGEAWGSVEGANPAELSALLKRFTVAVPGSGEDPKAVQDRKDELADRLRRLVNSAPVMLFMKGSSDAPRCGFSRKTVELLRSNNISFATFDILTDEEVRAGLKEMFEWPTFPQLYVRGSLMGGLDILNEMAEDTSTPLRDQLELTDDDIVPLPESIDDRLKKLLNSAPVLLFMKGSPDAPQCGFSRSIVGLLQDDGVEFSTFDILEDEEVRQELKRYSNWPTYPQLYVNGSLVGGLDIVEEMKEEGPLKEQLMM
jgi:Grx4 family monothiol glutaredoxin